MLLNNCLVQPMWTTSQTSIAHHSNHPYVTSILVCEYYWKLKTMAHIKLSKYRCTPCNYLFLQFEHSKYSETMLYMLSTSRTLHMTGYKPADVNSWLLQVLWGQTRRNLQSFFGSHRNSLWPKYLSVFGAICDNRCGSGGCHHSLLI